MSLHWWKTRWRTRGEYRGRAARFLRRFALALGVPLALVALILFVLFWVLGAPSRSGAREMQIEEVVDSVVAAVERGRPGQPASLEDFIAAGVLAPGDVEFLADEDVIFQPFSRSSPDTAVVFRRVSGGVERLYRKNGAEDHYTTAASPDGRYDVVIGPPAPAAGPAGGSARRLSVRALDARVPPRLVTSVVVPDHARAQWSPDGRFIAIESRPPGDGPATSRETFVLVVGPSSVGRLDLPASVRPAALLAPADRAARLQQSTVRAVEWRDAGLVVASEGTGWVGPPGEEGSRYVSVSCRLTFEISQGGVRELGRRC